MKTKLLFTKALIIPALVLAFTAGANAAVILDFNTTIGNLPGSPLPDTVAAEIDSALVMPSTLSRATYTSGSPSTGLNKTGSAGRFVANNIFTSALTNNLSGAIDYNKYFSFNVTPASGISLDLSEITFSLRSSSAAGAQNYALLSSVGGFTTESVLQQGTIIVTSEGFPTDFTVSNETMGTSFDSITAPVEFRIYLWGGTNSIGATAVTALQVSNAAAAVPEPATPALASLAAVWMLCSVRRRKRPVVG